MIGQLTKFEEQLLETQEAMEVRGKVFSVHSHITSKSIVYPVEEL